MSTTHDAAYGSIKSQKGFKLAQREYKAQQLDKLMRAAIEEQEQATEQAATSNNRPRRREMDQTKNRKLQEGRNIDHGDVCVSSS